MKQSTIPHEKGLPYDQLVHGFHEFSKNEIQQFLHQYEVSAQSSHEFYAQHWLKFFGKLIHEVWRILALQNLEQDLKEKMQSDFQHYAEEALRELRNKLGIQPK